jgi:hypothetical protein
MLRVLEALLPLREVLLEYLPRRRRRPLAGDILSQACAPLRSSKAASLALRRRHQREGTKATVLAPQRCQGAAPHPAGRERRSVVLDGEKLRTVQ